MSGLCDDELREKFARPLAAQVAGGRFHSKEGFRPSFEHPSTRRRFVDGLRRGQIYFVRALVCRFAYIVLSPHEMRIAWKSKRAHNPLLPVVLFRSCPRRSAPSEASLDLFSFLTPSVHTRRSLLRREEEGARERIRLEEQGTAFVSVVLHPAKPASPGRGGARERYGVFRSAERKRNERTLLRRVRDGTAPSSCSARRPVRSSFRWRKRFAVR